MDTLAMYIHLTTYSIFAHRSSHQPAISIISRIAYSVLCTLRCSGLSRCQSGDTISAYFNLRLSVIYAEGVCFCFCLLSTIEQKTQTIANGACWPRCIGRASPQHQPERIESTSPYPSLSARCTIDWLDFVCTTYPTKASHVDI